MNSKFINVFMFAAGAAIGSAVTWKIVKTRYDRLIDAEIESVKEAFADRLSETQEQNDSDTDEESEEPRARQINWEELEDLDESELEEPDEENTNDYKRLVGNYYNEKGGVENMDNKPYVISPYDYGELDGYSEIELTYYADGILEDDEYNIVTDAEELIGLGSLDTFGDYEEDSVFVRNDRLRTDFQILRDPRTYDEANGIGPGAVDDE